MIDKQTHRQLEGKGLTVLRFGMWGLGAAGGHADRRFEQWGGLRLLWHIQRAEAASYNSRWRRCPEIGGTGGGSGPTECCSSLGPLYFSHSIWRGEKRMIGGRGGMTGGPRGRAWSWGVMRLCGSVHVKTAGCSAPPLGLLDILLPGFYDNVQTAAYAAWPQGVWPPCDWQSCCRSYRQPISGCTSVSIFIRNGVCYGCRCKVCATAECCDGRAVILAPVAIGCQAVIGQEQLLPGERGRII